MLQVINKQDLLPALSFAAFVFWLLAVPMNGPLTAGAGITEASRYFLLPHVFALVLVGGFCPRSVYTRVAPVAILLTTILTLCLPLFPTISNLLLPLISACGAFVTLRACCRLHDAKNPVLSAAAGLVMGNVALLLLFYLPHTGVIPFAVATLPLLLLLLPSTDIPPAVDETSKLWHYLPFILVFHVVSGLMYSVIYPAYEQSGATSGLELPFYMITVAAAAFLVRISREILLIFGVLLGMTAFALLQWPQFHGIQLSMYAMQAGQGFIDLFLIAFLLCFSNSLRAFGFGLATLCLGIYGGQVIGTLFQAIADQVALLGHIVLNLAVLTLYVLHRRRFTLTNRPASSTADGATQQSTIQKAAARQPKTPNHLRLLLSDQEYMVVNQSLDGSTYRDIATRMDLSESSIKTYMKRACDKLGVAGRKGLIDTFAAPQQQSFFEEKEEADEQFRL